MLMNIMLYDGYMLAYLTLTCFLAGINSDQIYSNRIKADKSIGKFSFNFIFTLPLMFVYPLATVTNNYFSQSNTTSNTFFLILFFILCLPLFILAFPRYGLPLIGTKPFDKILDTNTVTSGRKYVYLLLFTVGLGEIIGLMFYFSASINVVEILVLINLIMIYVFSSSSLFILDSVKLDSYKSKSILSIISLIIAIISFLNILLSNSISNYVEYGNVNFLITPFVVTALIAILLILFIFAKRYIASSLYDDNFKYETNSRTNLLFYTFGYLGLICIAKVANGNSLVLPKANVTNLYLTFLIILLAILTLGISLVVLKYLDKSKTKTRKAIVVSTMVLLSIELIAFYNLYSLIPFFNGSLDFDIHNLILFVTSVVINIVFMLSFVLIEILVNDFKYHKWHYEFGLYVPSIMQVVGYILILFF